MLISLMDGSLVRVVARYPFSESKLCLKPAFFTDDYCLADAPP